MSTIESTGNDNQATTLPVGGPKAPKRPSFSPADESKLIERWEGELRTCKQARLAYERQWFMNLAFWAGKQWVHWDTSVSPVTLGRLVEPPRPEHRVRLTVNLTRSLAKKEHAKLNKEKIRGFISPASSDDKDIAAARAGEKLNSYLQELCKVDDRLSRADFWMLICGTGFTKDYYNERIEVSGAAQEQMNPETGQPEMVPTKVAGVPVLECVPPFQIYVSNLDEPDIDNQAFIIQEVTRTAHEIEKQYGVTGLKDEQVLSTGTMESRLQSASGYSSSTKKGFLVKEVWVAPCDEYPDGMVLTWTSERVLSHEPAWPYAHGEYPYTKRTHVETGRFYGESTITDLIPLQQEYNRTRSQLVEDKNRMARPMLVAQEGSFDPRKLRGVPGEVIMVKPGAQFPTALQLPNIPNYVIQTMEMIVGEMRDIASQKALEQNVPNGVTAATAIAYIQENQDAVLTGTLRDKEKASERVSRHLLSYVLQYWDAQRQIKVVGENQNFETFLLAASDLRGNTDWRVVSGSATPQSRSAQQALIMELVKMGVMPADRGLQFLDLGDTAKLFDEMQIDVREAERQNLRMSEGVPAETGDWQDLLTHVTTHDNYRKREEYENAPDDIKIMFQHHTFMDMYMFAKKNGLFDGMDEMQVQMLELQIQNMQITEPGNPLYVDPVLEAKFRSSIEAVKNGAPAGNVAPTQGQQPPQ